jgi:hypothetical protein
MDIPYWLLIGVVVGVVAGLWKCSLAALGVDNVHAPRHERPHRAPPARTAHLAGIDALWGRKRSPANAPPGTCGVY